MKANRKFVNGEEAVSAVIGVILMVAITVAIAATVYVWVTGFGGGGTPAPSMSLQQDSAAGDYANFTIISASSSAKWADLNISIPGVDLDSSNINITYSGGSSPHNDWPSKLSNTKVSAGDKISIHKSGLVGKTLNIIHVPSNSIIATKTIY